MVLNIGKRAWDRIYKGKIIYTLPFLSLEGSSTTRLNTIPFQLPAAPAAALLTTQSSSWEGTQWNSRQGLPQARGEGKAHSARDPEHFTFCTLWNLNWGREGGRAGNIQRKQRREEGDSSAFAHQHHHGNQPQRETGAAADSPPSPALSPARKPCSISFSPRRSYQPISDGGVQSPPIRS